MNDLILLGKAIKEKRLSLNMRMDDVAKKAGISRATLWSIERGVGNCSVSTLFKIMDVLGLSFKIDFNNENSNRDRATRLNTALDKKKNRFVIMCVEQYAKSINERSDATYTTMKEKGVIDELINDYEDLHGMSTAYLNDYIKSLIENGANNGSLSC